MFIFRSKDSQTIKIDSNIQAVECDSTSGFPVGKVPDGDRVSPILFHNTLHWTTIPSEGYQHCKKVCLYSHLVVFGENWFLQP